MFSIHGSVAKKWGREKCVSGREVDVGGGRVQYSNMYKLSSKMSFLPVKSSNLTTLNVKSRTAVELLNE